MLKKFCCIIVFVVSVLNISFSQQQDCVFKLQEAEKLYSQGLQEEIPLLLNPCIESGLTKEDRLQAYKLVILSYLFNDEQVEAENAMLSFLKRYPEYEISPTDAQEFIYLFESFSNIALYSFGISGGLNFTNISLREQYGTYNYNQSQQEYNPSGSGFQVGININRYIADNLEFVFELKFKQNKFESLKYIPDLDDIEFNKIGFSETQTRIEMPLSVTYDFEYGKLKPFLRVGGSIGYLADVSSKITREYIVNINNTDVKSPDIKISDYRNQLNYWGIVGGGLKYQIPRGYLILDVRFNFGLHNQVNQNNRVMQSSEQIWKYHYMDDNFVLNNGAVSVGYVYLLYKPERKQ